MHLSISLTKRQQPSWLTVPGKTISTWPSSCALLNSSASLSSVSSSCTLGTKRRSCRLDWSEVPSSSAISVHNGYRHIRWSNGDVLNLKWRAVVLLNTSWAIVHHISRFKPFKSLHLSPMKPWPTTILICDHRRWTQKIAVVNKPILFYNLSILWQYAHFKFIFRMNKVANMQHTCKHATYQWWWAQEEQRCSPCFQSHSPSFVLSLNLILRWWASLRLHFCPLNVFLRPGPTVTVPWFRRSRHFGALNLWRRRLLQSRSQRGIKEPVSRRLRLRQMSAFLHLRSLTGDRKHSAPLPSFQTFPPTLPQCIMGNAAWRSGRVGNKGFNSYSQSVLKKDILNNLITWINRSKQIQIAGISLLNSSVDNLWFFFPAWSKSLLYHMIFELQALIAPLIATCSQMRFLTCDFVTRSLLFK